MPYPRIRMDATIKIHIHPVKNVTAIVLILHFPSVAELASLDGFEPPSLIEVHQRPKPLDERD